MNNSIQSIASKPSESFNFFLTLPSPVPAPPSLMKERLLLQREPTKPLAHERSGRLRPKASSYDDGRWYANTVGVLLKWRCENYERLMRHRREDVREEEEGLSTYPWMLHAV